jgi:hypothetical protein
VSVDANESFFTGLPEPSTPEEAAEFEAAWERLHPDVAENEQGEDDPLGAQMLTSATSNGTTSAATVVSGWARVDLADYIGLPAEEPQIAGVFYPGRRHLISGPGEAAKTWLCLGAAVMVTGARPEQGEALVTGDVVNTAARIQSVAPVNGVASANRPTGRRVGTSTTSRSSMFLSRERRSRSRCGGRKPPALASVAIQPASTRHPWSVASSRSRC